MGTKVRIKQDSRTFAGLIECVMPYTMIDTHAHIYLDAFAEDRGEMIHRAKEAGVSAIYMPNIDQRSVQDMLDLEENHKGFCHAMMGLHPCSVQPDTWKSELAAVEAWLSRRPFVAIGEIGMDLYWDTSTRKIQEEAFRMQCQWAMELGIPVVIHSREAVDPLIKLADALQDGRLKGIFHCFSGDLDQANRILALGFYLGIGGPITYKNSNLPEVFAQIPLERVVLETDAPYLPPVPHRGKRNESAFLPCVVEKLAGIYGLSEADIAETTTVNAQNVYQVKV